MRSRSVAVAVVVAVLSAGGAVTCFIQANRLRTEAQWLWERGNAQAQEFANSFDDSAAVAQLKTFEDRRATLEQAHLWQRGQFLLILLAVVAAFSSYLLFLFHRLRVDLEEVSGEFTTIPRQ